MVNSIELYGACVQDDLEFLKLHYDGAYLRLMVHGACRAGSIKVLYYFLNVHGATIYENDLDWLKRSGKINEFLIYHNVHEMRFVTWYRSASDNYEMLHAILLGLTKHITFKAIMNDTVVQNEIATFILQEYRRGIPIPWYELSQYSCGLYYFYSMLINQDIEFYHTWEQAFQGRICVALLECDPALWSVIDSCLCNIMTNANIDIMYLYRQRFSMNDDYHKRIVKYYGLWLEYRSLVRGGAKVLPSALVDLVANYISLVD